MVECRKQPKEGIPKVLSTPAEFVASAAQLQAGTGSFAIDTERASSYRYDDRAFLIQIRRHGTGTLLFAPEGYREELTQALAPVLNGQHWIIHAAPSDLPSLGWLGLFPGTLFDTELAARFAGFYRTNLGAIIAELFDVQLEKDHGDDDWSIPQLTEEMRAYAALDVELLLELATALRDILAEQEKLDWMEEECAAIVAMHANQTAPQPQSWRDIKGVSSLKNGNQRAAAQSLWDLRDDISRQTDTAPGRVLPNKVLVEIARRLPTTQSQLARIEGFPRRRKGAAQRWFEAVQQSQKIPPEKHPSALHQQKTVPSKSVWSRQYPHQWEGYQQVHAAVGDIAEELTLPPDLLLRPATLRATVWAAIGGNGTINRPDDVPTFLEREGARSWQINLVAPVVIAQLFSLPH
ncbi:ribonuclease D [Corynebacterium macginleyi]|uniref:HRDC domain-containing protein n=1 Tax=Corynebacterium macginleyi TaxID=38290 RepID=UPI00190A91EB|nr:HRDC domain-containing protein [Corynebacterium macginleyi]MBK4157119.1 ribonuclease D [Corynebacterium macginleyi]MBK4161412.1 ribonuclease D [Corynebacterium macginleyi]MBK4180739.1 ribonuclease D [Corynebacterium macginleyi]MBK4182199.1 ribonuclease D [Corynebacterium macginleyi]